MITTAIRALSTQNLGGLFTLSAGDIKNINSRVSECIKGKHMAEIIAKSLPSFPRAIEVAGQWNSTLFPGMKTLCKDLNGYTDVAIRNFSAFAKKVDAIDPDKEEQLPAALKQEAVEIIGALKAASKPFSTGFATLSPGIVGFISANDALDHDILTRKLAFKMKEIADNLSALGKANGQMRGEWLRLDNDLENLAKIDAEDMDLSFIAKLELHNAIAGWEKLKGECIQFLKNNT